MRQPLLWLGGSFNPVHNGHLQLASQLAHQLSARVYLLPCGGSAVGKQLAPAPHRLAMLQLALAAYPKLHLDCRELNRSGASYSIDTLRQLRAEYGSSAHLTFVLGEDALQQLHLWREWRALLCLVNLLVLLRNDSSTPVASRPAFALQQRIAACPKPVREHIGSALCDLAGWKKSCHGAVMFWHNELMPISATRVRILAAQQKWDDLAALVPASVLQYMREVRP